MANGYKTLNLPSALVDELKIWQQAFELTYGKSVSYAKMIRSMLDSLPQSEPGVVETMDKLVKINPRYMDCLGNYNGNGKE